MTKRRGERLNVPGKGAMRAEVGGSCPFCEGTYYAAMNPPFVGHTAPTCPRFDALEPADYLAAVNRAG